MAQSKRTKGLVFSEGPSPTRGLRASPPCHTILSRVLGPLKSPCGFCHPFLLGFVPISGRTQAAQFLGAKDMDTGPWRPALAALTWLLNQSR